MAQTIAADPDRVNEDQDRVHMIVNSPDENQVLDVWFLLHNKQTCPKRYNWDFVCTPYTSVKSAYSEEFTLRKNRMKTRFVAPTRKYNMIEGYSYNNTI